MDFNIILWFYSYENEDRICDIYHTNETSFTTKKKYMLGNIAWGSIELVNILCRVLSISVIKERISMIYLNGSQF